VTFLTSARILARRNTEQVFFLILSTKFHLWHFGGGSGDRAVVTMVTVRMMTVTVVTGLTVMPSGCQVFTWCWRVQMPITNCCHCGIFRSQVLTCMVLAQMPSVDMVLAFVLALCWCVQVPNVDWRVQIPSTLAMAPEHVNTFFKLA
jgi:hypothetical protein